MPATPVHPLRLPKDPADKPLVPLLPTVVVASYKGGVGKTALAVPLAERLAWAGLQVLLMTCDTQEDARSRLGIKASDPPVARRSYGNEGSVTVAGIRGPKTVEVLYRSGPDRLGAGTFNIAVLDTPPEVQGGSLPGVFLITPVDGPDAARNLVRMLRLTPTNTDIVLVRLGREDVEDWEQNANAIGDVLERKLVFIDAPLPKTKRIKEAHGAGRSVWTLQRTGRTLEFLEGVEVLAEMAWERVHPKRPWPTTMPPPSSSAPYVPGWDDDEA